jgi:tetratricopeptide (TPR) repeat protein
MAYVRKHGNQVAVVHGKRDKKTGKVRQQVLFSFYSREEAREAIGKGGENGGWCFRSLLQYQYPRIPFNWKKITEGIEAAMDVLPETHPHREERVRGRFRDALCGFARQLIWTDPQHLFASAEIIRESRYELEFVRELIDWRLSLCGQQEDQWNKDNQFYWRYELHGQQVPAETEESVEQYYERGDLDRAEACFKLLIDSFEDYAEGYNYLGIIAVDRRRYDEAIEHFRRTVEVGRRLFPRRVGKKDWWRNLSTRPYMRGLRNLSLALNRGGRHEEALEVCERLADECGDDITAASRRAEICLNLGEWENAVKAAKYTRNVCPGDSFYAAFALRELGREREALSFFLHGALNYPRAACLVLGMGTRQPRSYEEARDHNAGVAMRENLGSYLRGNRGRRFTRSKRFFTGIMGSPEVAALLDELEDATRRWRGDRSGKDRAAFARMHEMHSSQFAERMAQELAPGILEDV